MIWRADLKILQKTAIALVVLAIATYAGDYAQLRVRVGGK